MLWLFFSLATSHLRNNLKYEHRYEDKCLLLLYLKLLKSIPTEISKNKQITVDPCNVISQRTLLVIWNNEGCSYFIKRKI